MNKYQLEMFVMVVDTKKISTAAKLLNITQPAISAQIKALETYLNTQLLDRTKQGVSPTPRGEIMYRYARKILHLFDNMEREIDELLGLEDREVIIGATYTIGDYALPCSIWTFKEKYPKANISLEIGKYPDIIQKLFDNKIHLAVVEGLPQDLEQEINNLKIISSAADEIIVIASPNSDFAKKEISLDELRKAPLLLPTAGLGIREVFSQAISRFGLSLSDFNIATQLGSIEAIKSSVGAGMGISICSRMAVRKELRQEAIKEVEINDLKMPLSFNILYRQQGFLPAMAHRFIRFISVPEELEHCDNK
ncbi:MAG: LysR family transcriptional regulator [Syntrophomonadaceae bacterium]|nr:LysR family transcriptional regulator [Syntrophomonadaceae bacterium]